MPSHPAPAVKLGDTVMYHALLSSDQPMVVRKAEVVAVRADGTVDLRVAWTPEDYAVLGALSPVQWGRSRASGEPQSGEWLGS